MKLSWLLVASVCLWSCGEGLNSGSAALCSADGGTGPTYASFGRAFLSTYCVSCHGGSHPERGIDLSTQAAANRYASEIVSVAGTGSSMPPAGSPTPAAAERSQLVSWLECSGG